jgi:hypothetical membrane protein
LSGRRLRIAGIAGLAAPIFTFACILIAIASWKGFSWTDNALSDLGVQSGITGFVFNSGLVISGFLFLFFASGLNDLAGKRCSGKVGTAVFAFTCIFLIAIGVFNEHFKPTHYLVSVAFFVSLPVSMLILAAAFWLLGKRKLGLFTIIVGFVAAAPWIMQFAFHYVQNVAVPEFASGLAGAAWTMVLGCLMLKEILRH